MLIMLVMIISSIGAQIKDIMHNFTALLVLFQAYCLYCTIGVVSMVRNYGFYDKSGHINVFFVQVVLMWFVLLFPFFFKPLNFLRNPLRYCTGFVCYYFSYNWWTVIINIYSICNLDDVSWGNRPSNASKGLNVAVDDTKRQEILRQNYRKTRTNILIGWLIANIIVMFIIDSLVLSALHNGNLQVKDACQMIIKNYTIYTCINQSMVLTLSFLHHVKHSLRDTFLSRYIPAKIYARPPVKNDPETKVLLDDTDEEVSFTPPVILKKKSKKLLKGKSEFETNDDVSFYSDDLESNQLTQKYRKKGGWTY